MADIEVIRQLRKETDLTVLECRELAEKTNYDFEKAIKLHRPEPEPRELDHWETPDDVPFYSKEKTKWHHQDIHCPHCDKEFYCQGFGASA